MLAEGQHQERNNLWTPNLHIRDQRSRATPPTTTVCQLLHSGELPSLALHMDKWPLYFSTTAAAAAWPLQHCQRG
jgi:hypothetical protein